MSEQQRETVMQLVRCIDQQRATIAAKREGLDRLELGLEMMLADLDFLLAPTRGSADISEVRVRLEKAKRRGSSLTEQVYSALMDRRGLPIGELARRVLGADTTKNRDRIRSLVNSLKNQGRLRRFSRGRWEIVQIPEEGAPPSVKP